MPDFSDYRVAVEAVLLHEGRVLLTKRAADCDVAPGCWCVPAGKVKFEEIPAAAVVRECFEETGIKISVVREIDCRTAVLNKAGKPSYRLLFTYLVEAVGGVDVRLNNEHSDYFWATRKDFENDAFEGLLDHLRQIIISACFG